MQDNDIYKAKEELADLYFYLKSYNSEEVTIKIKKQLYNFTFRKQLNLKKKIN